MSYVYDVNGIDERTQFKIDQVRKWRMEDSEQRRSNSQIQWRVKRWFGRTFLRMTSRDEGKDTYELNSYVECFEFLALYHRRLAQMVDDEEVGT